MALNIRVVAEGSRTWRISEEHSEKIMAWLCEESVAAGGKGVAEMAAELGVNRNVVRNWCVELGITYGTSGGYACITVEEQALLHSRLARSYRKNPGMWSFKFRECTRCGTQDSPHKGRGLCRKCYLAEWRTTRKPRQK